MDGDQGGQIINPGYGAAPAGPTGAPEPAPVFSAVPSASPADTKYTVRQAIADSVRAVRTNGVVILTLTVLTSVLGIVSLYAFMLGMLALLNVLNITTGAAMVAVLISGLAVYYVWYLVFDAFVAAMLGYAINDGAEGRHGEVTETLRRGMHMTGRVLLTNVLIFIRAIGPLAAFSVLVLILATILRSQDGSLASLVMLPMPFVALAGMIWAIVVAVRSILAPYVVLFEQGPVSSSLDRSRQLMQGGGYWFFSKATLTLIVVSMVLSALTGGDKHGNKLIQHVLSTLLMLAVNAVLLAYYRHRVHAVSATTTVPVAEAVPQQPTDVMPVI